MSTSPTSVDADFAPIFKPLFEPHRYKVCEGGRGGGRSWAYARALIIEGAQQPLRILCTREIQRSIRDSVHQLLQDQINLMGLAWFYTVKKDEIVGRNGTRFLFAGLRQQEILNLKSMESVDRCWVEEGQSVSEKSWQVLIPTIRKPGSEIWITFNPGMITDPTYIRFMVNPPPDTVHIHASFSDNPWFPEELEKERLHCEKTDPENYPNIWLGKPRETVEGAIYHGEIVDAIAQQRIRPVPYDPILKVHTVWDLGFNDATAIIFVQRQGSEIRLIDYIEDSHKTLDEYVSMIQDRRFNWGTDFLPHDGAAKTLAAGGRSPADIVRAMGRDVEIIKQQPVETGIKQARMIFRQCFFDEVKTDRLVECLKRYRRNIPTTTDEPAKPVHDEFSHGADAFRMLGQVADRLNNDEFGDINYSSAGIV